MVLVFFFKQKTASEIRLSLVGPEMCLRDTQPRGVGLLQLARPGVHARLRHPRRRRGLHVRVGRLQRPGAGRGHRRGWALAPGDAQQRRRGLLLTLTAATKRGREVRKRSWPFLAHFRSENSLFLRVFSVLSRRFQRAPVLQLARKKSSRESGPRKWPRNVDSRQPRPEPATRLCPAQSRFSSALSDCVGRHEEAAAGRL